MTTDDVPARAGSPARPTEASLGRPRGARRRVPFSARWRRRIADLRHGGALRMAAAALGGVATYAGFAPSTWWWSPIVGLALLGLAVYGRRGRAAAGLGFVFGCTLFLPLLTWSGIYVGTLPWAALSLAEAALVAPATALMGLVSRRLPWWPLWAACLWVGGETLRAVFPFGGFPWGGIAFTQPDGPLLPIVATVGEAGLAFAVALAGFALADVIRRVSARWAPNVRAAIRPAPGARESMRPATGAMAAGAAGGPSRLRGGGPALAMSVVLALLPFAGAVLASVTGPAAGSAADRASGQEAAGSTRAIAVIQGNVPEPGLEFNARRRAVLDMHAAETARLADAVAVGRTPQPVAVIWPENSSDIDPYRNADAAAVIDQAAQRIGVPILVGAVVAGPRPGTVYNMGIVWDPVTGPGETYTKRHPVPFGEYMPWRGFFRLFSDKVDLVRADFLPGSKPGNLTVDGVRVGDVICFEVVEDALVRDVVRGGAQVIVVQTNNATFGYTNETYQQQAMSRVRAVEYQRPVLIAATSGVSAVIDSDGTVQGTVGLFTAGTLMAEVPDTAPWTPSTVLGAPAMWSLTILGAIAVLAIPWRDRRTRTQEESHDV